jgi:purine-binding chemotaxis protein CheW
MQIVNAKDALPANSKYLSFLLGEEHYSLPITEVREIIRICPITPVPRMPSYWLGVINLRGKIVPVMNLRQRLLLPPASDFERACIVVIQASSESWLIGLLVDVVLEVASIDAEAIEPAPEFSSDLDGRYILGLAKVKDLVITVLDINALLPGYGTDDMVNNLPPIGAEPGGP